MLTLQQIITIVEDPDPQVRRQIIALEAAAEVWRALISGRPDLRHSVSLNKKLPDEVLADLARDDEMSTRVHIARKRRLPRELFVLLASDPHESVRHRIALNAKTPIDILKQLAGDPSAMVSMVARRRLADEG